MGPKPAPAEGSRRQSDVPSRCWKPLSIQRGKPVGFFFPFTFMLPAVQAQVLVMELLLRVIKDKFFRSPFD